MENFKILTINPGSDSIKLALFENQNLIFNETVYYSYNNFSNLDSVESKIDIVLQILNKYNITLSSIDAFSARAGGLAPLSGGVYLVNDLLLAHAKEGYSLKHASNLGVQIAYNLASKYNKPAFTVNLVTVDELQDEARITGINGIYRSSIFHALNQKEVAYQYAKKLTRHILSLI